MNWPGYAQALAEKIYRDRLHPRVIDYLNETPSGAMGLSCSGGIDSLSALLLIYGHFPSRRDDMSVLHFNHLLRGEDSRGDEQFVADAAAQLGLPFLHDSWDDRDVNAPENEADARKVRHAFFDRFLRGKGGGMIVLGHQQNDILETLMLRLARSSNVAGLAAPRPVHTFSDQKTYLRPLLGITRSELEGYFRELGIPWREDLSNRERKFDRNRLRNEIIPNWQAATQYDLVRAAVRVRQYLEEADEVIDRFLAASLFPAPDNNPARLPRKLEPRGVLRRWLYQWLHRRGLLESASPARVDEMLHAALSEASSEWPMGGGFVRLEQGCILFEENPREFAANWPPVSLVAGGAIYFPDRTRMRANCQKFTRDLLRNLSDKKYSERRTVFLDRNALKKDALLVRPWRAGDRYRPLNAPGSRKLQDLFVDRKIPREERKRLPVVTTTDSLVLWAPGLPVSHDHRITPNTKIILQLTYRDLL